MTLVFKSIIAGFQCYKEKVIDGVLYSMILSIAGLVILIPFIGPIIYSYILPHILRKISDVWEFSKGDMNHKEAFKSALLIYGTSGILFWIVICIFIATILHYISLSTIYIILGLVSTAVIQIILSLLFYASFIDIILGKTSEVKIRIKDSFFYLVVRIVTALIIGVVLGLIRVLTMIDPVIYLVGIIFTIIIGVLVDIIPVLSVLHYAANQ